MSASFNPYTKRQSMIEPDYEVYRYRSTYMNEVELHHHDFYEVYLLLRGRIEYIVENKIYRMRPGDWMLCSPLELHQARIDTDADAYERIVLWIARPYLDRLSTPRTSLTLDQLAEQFFISKYHLLRKFDAQVGTTVHRYILQKRLMNAKQLLAGGVPPNEVCQYCGFGDYANFYRAFKAEYNQTPRQYIQEAKGK